MVPRDVGYGLTWLANRVWSGYVYALCNKRVQFQNRNKYIWNMIQRLRTTVGNIPLIPQCPPHCYHPIRIKECRWVNQSLSLFINPGPLSLLLEQISPMTPLWQSLQQVFAQCTGPVASICNWHWSIHSDLVAATLLALWTGIWITMLNSVIWNSGGILSWNFIPLWTKSIGTEQKKPSRN